MSLRFESTLAASREAVWAVVTTARGINHELGPWVRMTLPRGVDRLDPATVPIGRPIGRSWLLLGGVVPIDYDDLTLLSIEPPAGFHERSAMMSCRVWTHRRALHAVAADRCVLVDTLDFETRWWVPRALVAAIADALFRHRHRRLRRRFGEGAQSPGAAPS